MSTKEITLKVSTLLLTLLLSVTLSNSTEIYKNILSLDAYVGTNLNIHAADFNAFNGMYNCGTFEDSYKFGFFGGIDLNYNISNDIELFTGVDVNDRSVLLSYDEVLNIYDEETGSVTAATNRYDLDASLLNCEVEFGVKYTLSNKLITGPFKFLSSAKLFFPLSSEFTQIKKAVAPEGHVLEIDGQTLIEYEMSSGGISDRYNPGLGINIGFQNCLNAGDFTYFTQTLSFDYCFSDIVTNIDWKHYSVNLALGFNFDIYGKNYIFPELIDELAEMEKAPVRDSATIIPVIVDSSEKSINPEIRITNIICDFHIEKGYELLCNSPKVTSVFFDKNSNQIPAHYLNYDNSLSQYDNPIDLHSNILFDILAILESNKNASLTLAAIQSSDESENQLTQKRLNSVLKFFKGRGIADSRIRTSNKIKESNEKFQTGYAENRRVDMNVEGVLLTDFVSKNLIDDVVGYTKILLDTNDIVFPNKIQIVDKYDKYLTMKSNRLFSYRIPTSEFDEVLSYQTKYLNKTYHDTTFKCYKSRMKTKDDALKLDNFLAVLTFEYNSDQLSEVSKQTLREMIDFLPEGVTIMISGSADISGTHDRNLELTNRRASNAINFLKKYFNHKSFSIVEEIDKNRYSNKTPVGRFLNRSIRIKIKKED